MRRKKVTPDNLWNCDEKGITMGRGGHKEKAIVRPGTKQAMALSEGSREFVSVLESISAAGRIIPPFMVYQGKTHRASYYVQPTLAPARARARAPVPAPAPASTIQVLWNVGSRGVSKAAASITSTWRGVETKGAIFAVSPSGYMDDELGFAYISEHFEPATRPKADRHGNRPVRVLIVDGHSSHVHYRVVEFARNHGIYMICLPPHSTHLMQPLDVGCFGLLQCIYQRQLRSWFTANPLALMNKAIFYSLLTATRYEVYTPEVIISAWKNLGCWPINMNYTGEEKAAFGKATSGKAASGKATPGKAALGKSTSGGAAPVKDY